MDFKAKREMILGAFSALDTLEKVKGKIRHSASLPQMSMEVDAALSNVKLALHNFGTVCMELMKDVERLNDMNNE